MRSLMILIALVVGVSGLAPQLAEAQTGSGSADAGSAAEAPAAQGLKIQLPEPTPEELRKICADAMKRRLDPHLHLVGFALAG